MLPENQLLLLYSQSLVGADFLLGQSHGNALPICSKVRKHTCREMNLLVCIMVLFKVDLNILMYLLIHSTLPGYFLFRWRRTALSLDSVLALQISWPLSSRSTSLSRLEV